jgi:hypothetical protein
MQDLRPLTCQYFITCSSKNHTLLLSQVFQHVQHFFMFAVNSIDHTFFNLYTTVAKPRLRYSLDEVGDGRADGGNLHGVRAVRRQRRGHGAGLGEGVVALVREGRRLRHLPLPGGVAAVVDLVLRLREREPHGVVQLRAPLQRRARRPVRRAGPGEQRLGVVDGVVGVVDARQRGHLGEAPGVGVGALAVVAQLRHAEAIVHPRVAVGRRPARRHHRRPGAAGEAAERDRRGGQQAGDEEAVGRRRRPHHRRRRRSIN